MNHLLPSILLFLLVWSGFLWSLSIGDEDALDPAAGPVSPKLDAAAPRTVESHAGPKPRSRTAAQAQRPVSSNWKERVTVAESNHPASILAESQEQEPDVPGAFPLDEQHWGDALPEEAGLEPIAVQPMSLRPEPLDNPWGGEWGDQGGGG